MVVDNRNMFLFFGLTLIITIAIFSGCIEKLTDTVTGGKAVTGRVDIDSLKPLFSKYSLSLNTNLEEVSIYRMDGTEISSQRNVADDSFSFKIPSGSAYYLKAQTFDGVNLWAITPVVSNDTVQNIDLNTTYEASLIVASLGKSPSSGINYLKQKAAVALEWDVDRLVKTVKRVVNSAVLKKVDYSPMTEVNMVTLRAFAGGLEPVRSLDSVLNEPEPDYIPFIYAGRYVSTTDPNNILITEIDGKRWDYRVSGMRGEISGTYSRVGFSIEDNPHVTNGGTMLVFTSTRHCFEEPYPCSQSYEFPYDFASIYVIPLDAPADRAPTRLLLDNKMEATSPMFSWDEEKIVFTGGPVPTENQLKENYLPGTQIYVMNKDGTNIAQLTFDTEKVWNGQPAWAPDNKQIVYASDRTGNSELWVMNADGSGNTQLTNTSYFNDSGPKFSPDGRQIVFESDRSGNLTKIYIMNRDGSNIRQLTASNNKFNDIDASWAHNGLYIVHTREIVYPGERSGVYNINGSVLIGLNTLTGKTLRDFGDFANARSYEDPVWAATNYILVPTKEIVEAGEFTKEGYVTAKAGSSRTIIANPPVQSAYEVKRIVIETPQATSETSRGTSGWCTRVGEGCDVSAYANRILGQAGYVPPPMDIPSWP